MLETTNTDIRSAAHALIDTLPPDATWDDVMYRVYVRQEIEAGLRDEAEGRVVSQEEAERRLKGSAHES
jgi:predicted transcriptional regulator